jgi:hypothetical protein
MLHQLHVEDPRPRPRHHAGAGTGRCARADRQGPRGDRTSTADALAELAETMELDRAEALAHARDTVCFAERARSYYQAQAEGLEVGLYRLRQTRGQVPPHGEVLR